MRIFTYHRFNVGTVNIPVPFGASEIVGDWGVRFLWCFFCCFCSIDVTSSYLAFRVIESINYFMVNSLTLYCDIAWFYSKRYSESISSEWQFDAIWYTWWRLMKCENQKKHEFQPPQTVKIARKRRWSGNMLNFHKIWWENRCCNTLKKLAYG